jgi:hypothetical protein
MSPDPRVIAELRSLFREGNTPSALIKHIVRSHPGEQGLFSLIQAYFREGFGTSIVRVSTNREDYTSTDLRLAHLNIHLVHQMVHTRPEWDKGAEAGPEGVSWLDSLAATDERELNEKPQPGTWPAFAGCWDNLGQDAQKTIKRLIGNADALYERVHILARLVESLQQHINELQGDTRNHGPASAPSSPTPAATPTTPAAGSPPRMR